MTAYCKLILPGQNPHLAAYALARSAASEVLGIPSGDVTIEKKPSGQPFFPSHRSLFLSISHSRDMVAAAVDFSPVGIDCQKIEALRPLVLKKCFTAEERASVLSPCDFYRIWTRKEAYFKMLGTGITDELRRFNSLACGNIQSFIMGEYAISLCSQGGFPSNFTLTLK